MEAGQDYREAVLNPAEKLAIYMSGGYVYILIWVNFSA
jgi:hypothetical protein